MLKNSVKILALLSVAAPALAADNFNYLSGGYLYQNVKNSVIEKAQKSGSNKKQKNFNGIYVDFNKEVYQKVFLSARMNDTGSIRNYVLGVGYHYPISSQVDIYGIVGLDKFASDELIAPKGCPNGPAKGGVSVEGHRTNIDPTIELGVKAALSEQFGLATSYRYAQHKIQAKMEQHEGRLLGYYNVNDKLAVEAGYTFTKVKSKDKSKKDPTINSANLGVRYYL